ncbi:MAG: hypothetical protein DUD39_11690 [Coriobacteriaceae bacterium]|nr:MAG: hypothetical protein DUD39_11690 [Coriobacteriaceae bacterium]
MPTKIRTSDSKIGVLSVATQIHTEQTYAKASLIFSYKDKKKAIDLYYHYGRKITAVTGKLTYPDKHISVQLDQRV